MSAQIPLNGHALNFNFCSHVPLKGHEGVPSVLRSSHGGSESVGEPLGDSLGNSVNIAIASKGSAGGKQNTS